MRLDLTYNWFTFGLCEAEQIGYIDAIECPIHKNQLMHINHESCHVSWLSCINDETVSICTLPFDILSINKNDLYHYEDHVKNYPIQTEYFNLPPIEEYGIECKIVPIDVLGRKKFVKEPLFNNYYSFEDGHRHICGFTYGQYLHCICLDTRFTPIRSKSSDSYLGQPAPFASD